MQMQMFNKVTGLYVRNSKDCCMYWMILSTGTSKQQEVRRDVSNSEGSGGNTAQSKDIDRDRGKP